MAAQSSMQELDLEVSRWVKANMLVASLRGVIAGLPGDFNDVHA